TRPAQIVPAPSGKFAYGPGANTPGSVALYTVDPKTGVLKFSNTFGSGVPSLSPFQSVMDRTGRFLYVTNDASPGSVAVLRTDTTVFDGSLTAGTPVAAGSFPIGIAETPAGTFVYVTNNGDGTISGYSVQADGALQPLSPATTTTGGGAAT